MNNKLICAFSLAPPIKRFCLFVAGVSALWGKIFLEIADIFHAPALSTIIFKKYICRESTVLRFDKF